jgi:tetratricopeptide (TPR) repeat protein
MTEPIAQRAEPATNPVDPAAEERRLRRTLRILVISVVAVMVAFAVVYYFGQRMQTGPSLTARAVSMAEEAVKSSPNDVGLRLSLATSYLVDDRPEQALAQYDEVLRVQKDNRLALQGAGGILYRKGDLAGAKARYQQIVGKGATGEFAAADKTLEAAYYFLGAIAMAQNDPATAITNLEAALKIDKTDADALNVMGNAQAASGNYEQAASAYQQALSFIPLGWCDPYAGLETTYGKLGKPDGVAYAQAMGEVCKGNGSAGTEKLTSLTSGEFQLPALIGLGLAAEKDKESAKAIDWYRQAVAIDPSNIAALTALARLGDSGASTSPTPRASASAS